MAAVRRSSSDGWVALLVIGVGLYFLRGVLIPFAMAVILWFVVDSLAHALNRRLALRPVWLARLVAIAIVLAIAALVVAVIVDNVAKFALRAEDYQARLDLMLVQAHDLARLDGPPLTVDALLAQLDLRGAVFMTAEATRVLLAELGLTFFFLVFMFSDAAGASRKLDLVFTQPDGRERARRVITAIQDSIRSYLLLSTVASFLTSVLTWAMLSLIGLNDALYWAVLMFFFNFIPVIGPAVAILLPTAFALMQFSSLAPVIATALSIGIWPFLFGNFLLPRLAGRSLNLSPLVVLLALAFWSLLWGVIGAFLAIPLSVMIMIALAQFRSTRPVAIFMSSDGQPHVYAADETAAAPEGTLQSPAQ